MNEEERCQQIFNDLEKLLTSKDYEGASEYLKILTNDNNSISVLKCGLVMTKSFKENIQIKNNRKLLLELFEKMLGHKAI